MPMRAKLVEVVEDTFEYGIMGAGWSAKGHCCSPALKQKVCKIVLGLSYISGYRL